MRILTSALMLRRKPKAGALSVALIVVLVLAGLLALLLFTSVGSYNGLQTRKTTVEKSIADLDAQFKRRYDLIPNLVATVQGAADFEKSTLQGVVDARASVGKVALPSDTGDPAQMEAYMKAQSSLGGALSRLLVVAENYPALRTTEQFRDLQSQLEGTENRITVARTDWTNAVRDYNTKLRTFPGNVIGGMFNFKELAQYSAEAGEREVPKVNFGTQK